MGDYHEGKIRNIGTKREKTGKLNIIVREIKQRKMKPKKYIQPRKERSEKNIYRKTKGDKPKPAKKTKKTRKERRR